MKGNQTLQIIGILVALAFGATIAYAENIDPYNDGSQYAYGENIGWLNFEPSGNGGPGAHVVSDKLTGYIWTENIGWISLSCENTSSCGTVDYGVTNDGAGSLSGYAWSENAGWISFSCDNTASCGTVDYGVTIDAHGEFGGLAWAENIGWINFDSVDLFGYNVQACKVSFIDLSNFVDDWLKEGPGLDADLYPSESVDFFDYSIFADYWLGYCPSPWPLK
ncbi:MAG: hypothetical protein ACYS6W_14240 [Planctomycetota bacterium]|jgi:hypothetical protein